jgi:hypothetical protein
MVTRALLPRQPVGILPFGLLLAVKKPSRPRPHQVCLRLSAVLQGSNQAMISSISLHLAFH